MSSTVETLRRMANQIANNVAIRGHDVAVEATADHIAKFWDPRMKERIFADDRSFLSPVARAAIDRLANTHYKPELSDFNSVNEVGHSDAG